MNFLSKAKLLDKQIFADGKPIEVLGLQSFRTEPRGYGIGKASLRIFERLARQAGKDCVFCFCADDVKDFYIKCGWYLCGRWGNKNLISSIRLNDVTVTEEW